VRQRPLAQLDQLVGTDDDFGERMPDRLALAEAEQILRRQIEIRDDEIFIESNDGNAESAEDALGTGCLARLVASRRGRRCGQLTLVCCTKKVTGAERFSSVPEESTITTWSECSPR
jgi:hypothetical protein